MMARKKLLLIISLVLLSACGSMPGRQAAISTEASNPPAAGMGMGGGMMARHHAQIPEEYRELTNPILSEAASWERGAAIYSTNCASCHGDGGMGDGPAGQALDPVASPIAHTSQMLGDNYLFWRISEGGTAFNSNMPSWKTVLTVEQRWDVINYVRALGAGKVQPQKLSGGATLQPGFEAAQQEAMLQQALAQGLVTAAEADNFRKIHSLLEPLMATQTSGDMNERQAAALAALLAEGKITQAEVDLFNQTHEKLIASELAP